MDLSKIENFQDAIVTVMGLGRYQQGSGIGTAKWLIRHGAQIIITDLKNEVELEESMDLIMGWYEKYRELYPERTIYSPVFVLGEHREEDFIEVDCVVQNPGVPSESEFVRAAQEAGVSIESDVSLFWRYCKYPIIAVTGTKGKTTTTKMIGEMLTATDEKAIIAGNINVSPLEFLDDLLQENQPHPIVLELSSWMLESLPPAFREIKKGPDIAVLTNVYPDHLNRYHSFGDYVHSKEIIFEWQSPEQYTILNWDQETVRLMGERAKGKVFWCSKTYQEADGCYVKDGQVVLRQDGKDQMIIPVAELGLKGDHNLENVLTSVAVAILWGISLEVVQKIAREFKGVSDRQELVREVDEITYVNDTTATNPDVVMAALNRFGADGDIILIAGGANKELSYSDLGDAIANTCKHLILFNGDASQMIEDAVADRVPTTSGIDSMKKAVQTAKSLAASGDIVLMSPGAASFNMFKNEFDRGEQFREEVRNL
ncbi:UDP-N-acetylmuramoyl-L-alanine--D-glutamate ligase [Candidatus Uhrbacteria bacterium CG_4_9_14_0_2_um_filter_41_50]|uniref:UDP-N-acetylmuramoylalanine--D-glutamate ligase n=1 Tax=Candidatus Uhrbacteria bacterium CG_4_9_14_0_2_um_filter_41_50 TaxID=1975031 RepID=A0A2M8ENN7_9BACT|nr:MAG: UDP-N-acetylmuramoyl-L-alanine--D-glutamate ligase [Candidatus Uhrbacteria bacterium CG_4_10_14_3_um_filter_41_21]PIZ54982.1 MAG: UDP-N-acetylmuramoyl-L-alanine--D-glutamate ligase [Candidatus Uhrbacteria bacterium CG_4_10_14_0_2_um_filter_41_21]PJB84347.1 MAG: UDP-N-acetylmuramoyl-L-alanine--D-glutamate ligase [Candidatus Uhrbacteria bacterium CG_4_9_14_0_8_um_filter_41_16]PJC24301.1 MAG: UDP-N-acetylmuramoyl-L-alanine--D-glutamate ligase [Candidatus Uhrbacteria bacterium CG_4_9_14_0_2_